MKKRQLSLLLLSLVTLSACSSSTLPDKYVSKEANKIARKLTPKRSTVSKGLSKAKEIWSKAKPEVNKLKNTIRDKYNEVDLEHTNYYKVVGKAEVSKQIGRDSIEYGKLDDLNRPTTVTASISLPFVKAQPHRSQEKMEDPIAWPKSNPKVHLEDSVGHYNGFFWNRSHLLADSLGGDCKYHNLVTGTRMQNVGMKNSGGMAYTEEKARQYIKANPSKQLFYQVIPVYLDDELIPRKCIVNIKTLEDDSIDEQVEVYNIAPGYDINYYTGDIQENKGGDK